MKSVAVVLPAYNEEQTIGAVIEGFHKALPDAAIWVVNNCSDDSTEGRALEVLSSLNCQGGIINERRPGKGNADHPWRSGDLDPLADQPVPGLVAKIAGFSLQAGTVCEAWQRSKLERLCRCITRPPIAMKRLSLDERGRVVCRYRQPFRDGTR